MNVEKKNLYVLIRGGERRPAYALRFVDLDEASSVYRFMEEIEINFTHSWWKLGRCLRPFGYSRFWFKETRPGDLIGIYDLTDPYHVKSMTRTIVDVCKMSFEYERLLGTLLQTRMTWQERIARFFRGKEKFISVDQVSHRPDSVLHRVVFL